MTDFADPDPVASPADFIRPDATIPPEPVDADERPIGHPSQAEGDDD